MASLLPSPALLPRRGIFRSRTLTSISCWQCTRLSSHSIDVDPATGAIEYSGDGVLDDPLGGEIFDTPEFAQSAEGHAQASGRDETV